MKFCENCGTQLDDDIIFCEECGAKQGTQKTNVTTVIKHRADNIQSQVETNNAATQVENMMPKLSEICTPAKRKIRGWLMILLLVICSPLVLVNSVIIGASII